jgi:hypothetical protein
MSPRKGIKAWLITWEYQGDHAKVEQQIVAILPPRWASERIRQYVEFIYILQSPATLQEQIEYAKKRSNNPYLADYMRINGVRHGGNIICGHNPWLYARKVSNLQICIDENGNEKGIWKEIPPRQAAVDILKKWGKL